MYKRQAFSAFSTDIYGNPILTNTSGEGVLRGAAWYGKPLFTFGPGTPLDRALHAGDDAVARFYAVTGDVVGLKSGSVVDMSQAGGSVVRSIDTWYEAAIPVSFGPAATSWGWTSPPCTTTRATCR